MLRFPSRLIDSFASAQTLPAASGRLRRCVESCRRWRSSFVMSFCTAFPFFLTYFSVRPMAERWERDAMLFCLGQYAGTCYRFRLLFIASSSTVFPSFSLHTTPVVTGGASKDRTPCLSCSESAVFVSEDRPIIQGTARRSPVTVRATERANPCRCLPLFQTPLFRKAKCDIYSLKAALRTGVTHIFKYFVFERPFRRTGPDIQCQR